MTTKTIKRLTELFEEATPYDNYPFSWDVKITFGPTVAGVRKVMAESFYLNDAELFTYYPDIDKRINKFIFDANGSDLFTRVTESMWDSWKDADTYSMCDPKRLKSWGAPYGMEALGVKGAFKTKFGLYGRSSGHLVVEEFEGIDLKGMVVESLPYYTDPVWFKRFGAMIEEWNHLLTPVNVHNEFVYTIAWMLNAQLEDSVEVAA